jgi:hypothetical protein
MNLLINHVNVKNDSNSSSAKVIIGWYELHKNKKSIEDKYLTHKNFFLIINHLKHAKTNRIVISNDFR